MKTQQITVAYTFALTNEDIADIENSTKFMDFCKMRPCGDCPLSQHRKEMRECIMFYEEIKNILRGEDENGAI